jgi:hypothetical protein
MCNLERKRGRVVSEGNMEREKERDRKTERQEEKEEEKANKKSHEDFPQWEFFMLSFLFSSSLSFLPPALSSRCCAYTASVC